MDTWTASAQRIKGYTAEEIVGKSFSLFYTQADIERGHPEEVLRIATKDGYFEEEDWRVRKDGSLFWASVMITALRDDAQQLCGFSKLTRDITQRRNIELQLVAEKQRAEAANQAKSAFLAAMSHEIRTPMNAILGMSDMLAESQLDPEQMQYVEVFRRAGANLLTLINDILDLSKIEAGHLELECMDFDLEEVVDQAIEIVGIKTRAKAINLMAHLSPDLASNLTGDPNRLRQVLINLLGNAVNFTQTGTVLLEVKNHDSGRSGELEFAIIDTGIGIPGDKLESIFDRFTQVDSSITRTYGATGLGLEISRRLAEHMGGSLTATSRVGTGSIFRFRAQFGLSSQPERKASLPVTDFRDHRVLVIDDNATSRFILSETLKTWGIESDDFGVQAEALASLSAAIAANRPFSLVLLDREMPGMDGFETAAGIRQIAPNLPLVMLMSDSRPGDILRRREAGLSGYAVKPVKRCELLRLIGEALRPRNGAAPPALESVNVHDSLPVKPLRILIADDSADNRLLIQVYLKGRPDELTFVEDGREAVNRFAAGSFDLALMDMQMPLMDGITATRAMREIELVRRSTTTPIIALTADALPQDAAASCMAGCNLHLSKPISKRKLINAIEEFGRAALSLTAPEAEFPKTIRVEILPDLEDIVPGYLASRRGEISEMMELLAASNFEQLAMIAHNIKGTGSSYGFPELTRMGGGLEYSAQQTDRGALIIELAELNDYLGRVQLFPKAA